MTYPTFETRLVPISEAPKDSLIVVVRKHNEGFSYPIHARYIKDFKGFYFIAAFGKQHVDDSPDAEFSTKVTPTHFLQFKINGEWTHEFKPDTP